MFIYRGLPLAGAMVCVLMAASTEAQSNINALKINLNSTDPGPGRVLTTNVAGFPNTATIHDAPYSNNAGLDFRPNTISYIFSADGGVNARKFLNQQAFDIGVDVTMDAGFETPRKEAGLRINFFGFDGQFIVTSNSGENGASNDGQIAAFGGTIPFYSFTDPVIPVGDDAPGGGLAPYVEGETINMRMIYTPPVYQEDPPPPLSEEVTIIRRGTMQYIVDRGAGPISSPIIEFPGSEAGLHRSPTGSEIGVYGQGTGVKPAVPNGPTEPDFLDVVFENFDIAIGSSDFDYDGDVDGADFLIFQQGLGTPVATVAQGDANGDDAVNSLDLDIFRAQFGNIRPAATEFPVSVVPEPASIWLIASGGAALAAVLRRRTKSRTI